MEKGNEYIFSVRAKDDIKNIAKYTIDKFGVEQSKRYAVGLKQTLEDLSVDPELGRPYMPIKKKMLLRYRYKAHIIFYYPNISGIFVVRVLGGKMNFIKHIK